MMSTRILRIIKSLSDEGNKRITLEALKARVGLLAGTNERTWNNYKEFIKTYTLFNEDIDHMLVFNWPNIYKLDDELARFNEKFPVFLENERVKNGNDNSA